MFRLRLLLAAPLALAIVLALLAPAEAAYPGSNGRIIYSAPDHADIGGIPDYDLWTIAPTGGSPEPVTLSEEDEADAVWSPDGTRIAFVRGPFSDPSGCARGEIYVSRADGTEATLLTGSVDVAAADPTWSPDGQKLAYTRITPHQGSGDPCSSHDGDIWSMNADGTGHVQLTSGGTGGFAGSDSDPAWSPDGDRIAFSGYRENAEGDIVLRIRTMDTDGTNQTAITDPGDPPIITAYNPTWSPDGDQVAFERLDPLEPDGWQIWKVDEDGTDETPVTENAFAYNAEPAWSPDGTKIVFMGQDGFDIELYTIDVDGTDQTQVTFDDGDNAQPDWQPIPPDPDLVVDDCDDPTLTSVTEVTGDLVIDAVPGCGEVTLPNLTEVGGGISIVDNTAATVIDLGLLESAGSVEITGNTSATIINLGELVVASGSVDIGGNTAATTINLGDLATAGSVDIGGNTSANTVDLSELTTVTGSAEITGNTSATVVDVGSLADVSGSAELESAGATLDLGGADVDGDLALTGNGSEAVIAGTGGGETSVSMLGGVASMTVALVQGSFSERVAFTIERRGDLPPEEGTTAAGDPAEVDAIAGYEFMFAVPTLNEEAELTFTVDLAELDAPTRAALLQGVADGGATLAVKGDGPDDEPQAFARCGPGQAPAADGCVTAMVLGADGQPVGAAEPAFVRFEGIAGHFSTWSVALVEETSGPVDPPVNPPKPPAEPPPVDPGDEACDRARTALVKAKAKLKKAKKAAAKARGARAKSKAKAKLKKAKARTKKAKGRVARTC